MKNSFLEYVARDIISKWGTNLARTAIVFPNKRASLFMNDHLARLSGRPMWSPAYITISDLFRKHSQLTIADPIQLVCELHKVFTTITGKDETLDQFYGWGQLLLSDFDDIDKNMADAEKVFANLRDLREFDDVSFLTDDQKEMLARFFKNFTEQHQSVLRKNFLELWSRLYNIYTVFNERLLQLGIAYEGALYRRVASDETIDFNYDNYIFVGFNMVQKVEQQLFSRLMKQGRAHFYWDFDEYYMRSGNESGHFIDKYLKLFPNELDNHNAAIYSQMRQKKDIDYISAPTQHVQARYVSQWLRQNNRIAAGRDTAIVLCDESLLTTVVASLPPEVKKVNITTGYPLSQSPFAALVIQLITLQTEGCQQGTGKYRLRQVSRVLRHPYARFISDQANAVLADFIEHKQYYPTRQMLSVDEGMSLLFSDINTGASLTEDLTTWMCNVLTHIGTQAHEELDPFFQESLFRTYTLVNRLRELIHDDILNCDVPTLRRLLTQLIQSTSIPFHGEPAEGIQIMGVLETRNLDFEHILVLSCNEGNMPKGLNDSSFIPYNIRKAYDLTTIDNKVAIYAYYFHSMLQRATDISLVYSNATEDGNRGEMSRFMLQLLVESPHSISRHTLQTGQTAKQQLLVPIQKNQQVIDRLNGIKLLSPTAITTYLRCQKRFYYRFVAGIAEPDNTDTDEMDNRTFGNIFHRAAELAYLKIGNTITKKDIEAVLGDPHTVEEFVDQAFREELFHVESPTFRPEYNGLQIINRRVIIDYLKQLLSIDKQLTPFRIIKLEEMVTEPLTADGQQTIGGVIDRLDVITDKDGRERIRVIDYKTGNNPPKGLKSVGEVFDPAMVRLSHSDYYFQTMLYAKIVARNKKYNPDQLPVSPALIFIQHASAKDYDPTLIMDKHPISDITVYEQEFNERLAELLAEIHDPSLGFVPTPDRKRCTSCPYHDLCAI